MFFLPVQWAFTSFVVLVLMLTIKVCVEDYQRWRIQRSAKPE